MKDTFNPDLTHSFTFKLVMLLVFLAETSSIATISNRDSDAQLAYYMLLAALR